MLALKLGLRSFGIRSAAVARDLWQLVNDTWQNEHRNWEDIV